MVEQIIKWTVGARSPNFPPGEGVTDKQERKTGRTPVELDYSQRHQYKSMFSLIYIQIDTEIIIGICLYS